MPAPLPDPLYYLRNFRFLLQWVGRHHARLLATPEQDFLELFPALPEPSQALLVRMVMRRGGQFRLSALHYPEIGDTGDALAPLAQRGWVDVAPALTLRELAQLLRKRELAAVLGLPATLRKDALLASGLEAWGESTRPLATWYPALPDSVCALRVGSVCECLRLLFFGNLHQDWSTFVLADLGIHQYEPVALEAGNTVFQQRKDVETYLLLWQLRERLEAGEAAATLLGELPAAGDNPWLETRRQKLLFRLARELERQQDHAGALAAYRCCIWPGARTRQLRVLERMGDGAAALALAEGALAAPENEEELQHLQRLLPRLRRRQGLPAMPQTPPADTGQFTLTLPAEPGMAVEQLARAQLDTPEAPVFYVENSLLNSLFGLLCWPAVFAPLPGAFFHPFQQGPADLHAPDFHARRAALFAGCLRQLDAGSHRETILDTWHGKHGRQSPFVFWDALDEPLLRLALDCLPATHLRLIFTRLLEDIPRNRSGFPDLIQFWPSQGRYRMIEVKGPGDRVQDNQQRWLSFFARHGMPAAVCHVRWAA